MSNREKIIAAAIKHLNKEPTASMARLAEAIGTSRATLHRHFASREALIHELGERSLDRWEASQNEAGLAEAAASGDPERIAAALRTAIHLFVLDVDEYGFTLTDHFLAELPDLVARANELEEREVVFYTAAQRAGVLRSDVPVRWISYAVYGLLIAARDSLRYGNVARRDLDKLVLETFLNGNGAGGIP
ncbi:TetR/AcrR family transcriptional regulator [Actinomadura rudentiformis]|uniref:TetR/AcrR family transcriptional regulator n=1 Tax=Actinomadura rudentiformis TaxID=359158 RepID=A0A6H9YVI5_9ACTN|nr:TetR/AcrR family transcriptional regulator [Actinomadura rudentiformis]KAB2344023.1 TetR/AcrR family transcriptional regulator [Actinomadura rudentiformis]